MIKKFILFFLFLCILCTGCSKKKDEKDDLTKILERGTLLVGVRDDTAPFGFKDDNGNLTGYDIDLAKQIAKGLLGDENKIKFIPVTASDRIKKLSSGEVDILVATVSITNQRLQILNFSRPYYIAGQAILVNKTSEADSLSFFKGKKLIVVFGSTSERTLRTSIPDIEVIGFKNYHDAYQALKEHRAEGLISDDTILLNYAVKDDSVKLLPKRYSKEPYAVAVRKESNSERLLSSIDYVIENLTATGKLFRMQEKWNLK